MKVGVLALQGAFREHREVLDALGVESIELRTAEPLGAIDALIMPGGESTTMSRLLDTSGLREPLAPGAGAGLGARGNPRLRRLRGGTIARVSGLPSTGDGGDDSVAQAADGVIVGVAEVEVAIDVGLQPRRSIELRFDRAQAGHRVHESAVIAARAGDNFA